MSTCSDDLDRLGEAIAQRQDAGRDGQAREEARRALFGGARRTTPAMRRPRIPALAFAAVALAVTVVVGWPREPASPPPAPTAVVEMGVHRAPAAMAERLAFADGSEVRLEPAGSVRVDRIDGRGASLVLLRGALFASVVGRGDTHWTFDAGDFRVTVTGTAFDLRLEPPALVVVMHEGSVRVTGPGLGDGRVVRAGERARFVPPPARRAPAPSAPPAAASASSPPPVDWRARAERGDHDGAFEAVAPRLDAELATLDGASLLRLATVARLSGHPETARRVYLRLRERFPGTPAAAQAAFALGAMAFGSDDAGAERWLRIALAEGGAGSLGASIRGRLLELALRRGDAKVAAEDYLRHHPDGPHAALARDALAP